MSKSKGGMQSTACHSLLCPICHKSYFRGIESYKINIYNHWTKSGKVVYCDNQGNKRKVKIHDEFWKLEDNK
jgi:hypothetical protein